MTKDHRELTALLQAKNLRPSYQRLKVLEYLQKEGSHPTVEDIHQALMPGIPSLSKATVYNTLHTFIQAGLASSISIDDGEMRYDHAAQDHGHFKCTSCGDVFNFGIDPGCLPASGLEGFDIREKAVYFKGLCPACLHDQPVKGE